MVPPLKRIWILLELLPLGLEQQKSSNYTKYRKNNRERQGLCELLPLFS